MKHCGKNKGRTQNKAQPNHVTLAECHLPWTAEIVVRAIKLFIFHNEKTQSSFERNRKNRETIGVGVQVNLLPQPPSLFYCDLLKCCFYCGLLQNTICRKQCWSPARGIDFIKTNVGFLKTIKCNVIILSATGCAVFYISII